MTLLLLLLLVLTFVHRYQMKNPSFCDFFFYFLLVISNAKFLVFLMVINNVTIL